MENTESVCEVSPQTLAVIFTWKPKIFFKDHTLLWHGGKDGVRSHGVRSHGVRSHGVRSHEVRSHGVTEYGVTEYGVTKYGVTEYGVYLCSTSFSFALDKPPRALAVEIH